MKTLGPPKTKTLYHKLFLYHTEPDAPIDPFVYYDIQKLNKLKNNSVEEIFIQDLLDYSNGEKECLVLINTIMDKLKGGGSLHIQSTEPYHLCASLLSKQIDVLTFRAMVFAVGKKTIFALGQIKSMILDTNRARISQAKFINGFQYYLLCVKNE